MEKSDTGDRLARQLDFLFEIDKVKQIVRRTKLFDGSRFENDAEHAWTVCMMSAIFAEYARRPVDAHRVLIMLLIHDIVEIDAGDTFLYGAERAGAHSRELLAAQRIFGILPDDQAAWFMGLWEEFEEQESPEAQFAAVFDRLEPILQNYKTQGFTWKKHGVTRDMVMERNKHIQNGSPVIWDFLVQLVDGCVAKGYLSG